MFWKNNSGYFEEVQNYFENKSQTNFTYAKSSSYRVDSKKSYNPEPYLYRNPIHMNLTSSHSEEVDPNVFEEMSVRKTFNTQSVKRTPVTKKVRSVDSDRILRSRSNLAYNENVSKPFVREHDVDLDCESMHNYRIGALNTNTNNSGPEKIDDRSSPKISLRKYDFSGDEEIESDIDYSTDFFGSNNANVSKVTAVSGNDKSLSTWFQKNMFGLPNEESDETNQDMSNTISGDELYDMLPFEKTSVKTKSKRMTSKRSSRFDHQTQRSFTNILCSPLAMISFIFEWIWGVIRMVGFRISHNARIITDRSSIIRWMKMPFYVPGIIGENIVTGFSYVSDRLFGTTFSHRLKTQHRRKKMKYSHWFYKLFWLLLFIFLAVTSLHLLPISNTDKIDSHFRVFNVTPYVHELLGTDCMTEDYCCSTRWAFVRRFTYCLVSLPIRMIISTNGMSENIHFHETPHSLPIISDNSSNLKEYIDVLKSRLEYFDKQLTIQNAKMEKIEENFKIQSHTQLESEKKIVDLSKNIGDANHHISTLQRDLEPLKNLRASIETSLENLSKIIKEDKSSMTSNQENMKNNLINDMKTLKHLIEKIDIQSLDNSKINNKLEKSLDQIKTDLTFFQRKLNEVEHTVVDLDLSNKRLINDTDSLKQEIMDHVNEEIRLFKSQQNNLEAKLNSQISSLERSLEENRSKIDDNYLNTILDNFSQNIRKDINSSIWLDLKDHVRNVLKSENLIQEQFRAINTAENMCNCLPSSCRCNRSPRSCVRINEVRRLLNEALALFAADKIGMADYALESAGGTVATTRCTETYTERASTLTIFGIPLLRLTNSPRTIIQPSLNPGECWPMKGSTGSVVVQLSANVKVGAVTIDHIPKSLSPSENVDSALKDFEIKALTSENDKIGKSLGNFTYLIDSSPVQTFTIEDAIETKFVELIVNSNHGNKEYTCIYRFRVHGKLVGA